MSTFTNYWPAPRANTASHGTQEAPNPANVTAAELRAKAARYRLLAEDLHDRRVIAEVHACVRELEAKAESIDAQTCFEHQN